MIEALAALERDGGDAAWNRLVEAAYAAGDELGNAATDDVLVRRFESVRRAHPLQGDGRLVDGIAAERELLAPLRDDADLIIDTSTRSVHDLRHAIENAFASGGPPISAPGSVCRTPAQRAPSPIPGSSETTVTSTSPSRSLVPTVVVTVARTRSPLPTQPKSAIDQPGLIGQGR